MFISDMKIHRRSVETTAMVYLLAALFCVIFGAVYEVFSHEVYSGHMIYAFLFPLVGGTLPFLTLLLLPLRHLPGRIPLNLYHSGIAAMTVGCIFQGVLDIYGTTNSLILVYWIAGLFFTGLGVLLYLSALLHGKSRQPRI